MIQKSVKAHRIKQSIDDFDFELTADEVASIGALDTASAETSTHLAIVEVLTRL